MENGGDSGRVDKGKGKGKAEERPLTEEAAREHSAPGQDDNSLASRILRSASALSSSVLSGTPSTTSLNALTSGEKGQQQPGAGRETTRAGESSDHYQTQILPSTQGFKSSHTQDHAAREEMAFQNFLDGTDVLAPPQTNDFDSVWQETSAKGSAIHEGSIHDQPDAFVSVMEQEQRDGEDVLALLSSHVEEPPTGRDEDQLPPAAVANLRRALFGDSNPSSDVISPMEWDNVLNFVPGYLWGTEQRGSWENTRSSEAQAHQATMQLGTGNLPEARQIWIEQWSRVLTGYQDEVWGDLESLVQEARAEVEKLEEVSGDAPTAEPKALLRLRAILGHLRGA